MSHSKGKLHKAECCPWCGTRTLVRDEFVVGDHREYNHVSYVCTLCCAGFSIRDSPRANFVNLMYARERKQRPPNGEHIQKGGSPPLGERSLSELTRLEELLRVKRPSRKVSKETNAANLAKVQAELNRRLNR